MPDAARTQTSGEGPMGLPNSLVISVGGKPQLPNNEALPNTLAPELPNKADLPNSLVTDTQTTGRLPNSLWDIAKQVALSGKRGADAEKTDWREEVIANGKYFIRRKGSKQAREYRWGGYFDDLPEARKQAYYVNRERRRLARAFRDAAREARNASERS